MTTVFTSTRYCVKGRPFTIRAFSPYFQIICLQVTLMSKMIRVDSGVHAALLELKQEMGCRTMNVTIREMVMSHGRDGHLTRDVMQQLLDEQTTDILAAMQRE